jgi:hypothetical protein
MTTRLSNHIRGVLKTFGLLPGAMRGSILTALEDVKTDFEDRLVKDTCHDGGSIRRRALLVMA